ncbi:hypothetical protein FA15DRAFT_696104 [Coprinopsis marcescibilis]|uniref:Uncharacterized protein n=1 Tax=Coprinopsis marcescibilis TaxID=230819 RepID=A0A5C3KNQ4_COPMA|nr:hypothetical protein FA15DRAFT_696104 [Coprinopsis marcescibilis]
MSDLNTAAESAEHIVPPATAAETTARQEPINDKTAEKRRNKRRLKRAKKKTAARREGPLQTFFDRFSPAFIYDPTQPVNTEYERLEQFMREADQNWNKHDAKNRFQKALVAQFNKTYGKDVNSLTGWQTLCATLRIEPIPDELEMAKEAVLNKHVNLVDLTDAYDGVKRVETFDSEKELSEYTLRNNLIFSRHRVPTGTLLYFLLRRILHPPPIGSRRNAQGNIIIPGAPEMSNDQGKKKKKRGRGAKKRGNASSGATEV